MGKEKTVSQDAFLAQLFQAGVYKSTQGRVTRQVTWVTMVVIFALMAMTAFNSMGGVGGDALAYLAPFGILAAGVWVSYRAVNYARFADFLIAVEAEMKKVSWPSKKELIRASVVVIVVIVLLAGLLFSYDLVWQYVFYYILRIR